MRIAVVGGSNTVVNRGYLHFLKNSCQRKEGDFDIRYDLSTGNTTCGYGILQLLKSNALKSVDTLIIEYALNDEFIYSPSEILMRRWSRTYEALIRFALRENPKIEILSIIFDTRQGPFRDRVPRIASSIYYISEWYGVNYIDINADLSKKYGKSFLDEPFYMPGDSAHYSPPLATAMIANLVSEKLYSMKSSVTLLRPYPVPDPIDPLNYSKSSFMSVEQLSNRTGVAPLNYSNWRFSTQAVNIRGKSLRFRIEGGIMLGIEYVCEANTIPIIIERDGISYVVSTMKHGVKAGEYKFLTSYITCEFLNGDLAQDSANETVYVLRFGGPIGESIKYTPRDGFEEYGHNPAPEGLFPIVSIHYTGNMLEFTDVWQ